MKKTFTYQFITSLLLLVVLSIGEVWGDSQTWTFQNGSDGLSDKSPISVTYGTGGAANNTTVSGSTAATRYLRLYPKTSSGNGSWVKFTIATGYQITSVIVNAAQNQSHARYGVNAANEGAAITSTFNYTNGSATVSNLTATSFTIKNGQTSGDNKTVGFASITITYSSTCDKSVGLSAPAAGQINGTISLGSTSVTTCSSTATDRQVTITVTPSTGYNAPDALTFTKTSGTATATKVSGPTGSGPYTYVYRFAQNDNGAGTFGATCTAKTTTVSFNQNGGEGGQTSDVTATYGQAMPTPITTPTRYGHTFGGYYDGTGGTGNIYYNADGTSAATWNKEAATATLYAKWTEHGLTNYRTTCCTPLGTINGSLSWNNPTEAVVSWDNLDHVSSWAVTCKVHEGSAAGTIGSITTNGAGKKTCTITGLTCNTNYDFTISATANSGYCDKEEILENETSPKYSITRTGSGTVTGGTFTTKISSDAVTEACNGSTISIAATPSAGYQFSSWTITKAGGGTVTPAAATASTSFTMPSDNVTVTAAFGYKTYTITYKDKGGGAFTGTQTDPPTTHTYGTATTLKIPTKENYSFGGWFTDSDCESGAVGNASSATLGATAFTADITLYAKWVANTHTVTYVSNGADGGSVPVDANSPYNHGATVTVLGNTGELTKTHYSFGGWSDGVNTYEEGEDFDISDDVTLSAVWNCAEYVNVSAGTPSHGTFSLSATGSRYTCDGAQLITVSASANTGYEFSEITQTGVNSGVTIDNNAKTVTYAQWANGSSTINVSFAAKTVTVTWNGNGGTASSASNNYTYDGSSVALATASREGYDFAGWWTAADGGTQITEIGTTNKPSADIEYFAHWTIKHYTVTWNVNGSPISAGSSSTDVTHDNRVASLPTAPTDNTLSCANKFMGWSAKSAGSTPKTTSYYDDLFTDVAGSPAITGNTTFYAVFAEQNIYSGRVEVNTTNSGVSGGGYVSKTFTVDDIEFAYSNWQKNTNIQAQASNSPSLKNNDAVPRRIEKIVVKQTGTARAVSVKGKNFLDSDAATTAGKAFESATITQPTTATTMTFTFPANKSYPFFELNTPGNAVYMDSVVIYYKEIITSNYVTECDANIVKVTYDANGGATTCAGGSHDKTTDYTVCATEPTRDYYTFAGWLCSEDGETYNAGATIDDAAIDADFTLTAQWTPVPYSITYNLNGGTNGSNPASYNITTADIVLEAATNGHQRFEGWFTDDGVWSDQITSIPLGSHGDITLYAKWATRHEIIFDADGVATTIYRADDENMEDAVAGMGSKPADPDAPSTCSTKVFVGWSESTIDDETDTEPADLFDGTGAVDEDKHYYAVWATGSSVPGPVTVFEDALYGKAANNTTFSTYGSWESFGYVYGRGISTEGVRVSSTDNAGYLQLKAGLDGLASVDTIKFKIMKYGDETATITLSSYSGNGTYDNATSVTFTASSKSAWEEKTCILREADATTDISFEGVAKNRIFLKDIKITKAGMVTKYTGYATSCCATKVTLTQNDPEHGTIAFGKSIVGTCGGDKEVSLTITPAAGYQLSSYAVATGDGKVAAKSMSAEVVTNNNSSAAQNITLTFTEDANGAYDVTAAFSEMRATEWIWTTHDGGEEVTTEPLEVYVGQQIRIDVSYSPAGLLSSHTNNTAYNYSPSPWSNSNLGSPSRAGAYFTITGTNAGSTSVVLNHNDGLTKTIYYTVKALPLVHFVDIVHNVVFADVAGTLEANALVKDKTTPTMSDFSGTTYNTCEEQHEHLVGWIESSWADENPNATHSEIAGAGAGVFYTAGASIDVDAQNGKTFYAVWATIE